MSGLIARYLEELSGLLHCSPNLKERILAEVEEHLTLAARREQANGLNEDDAAKRAVLRFGPPRLIAEEFKDQFHLQIIPVEPAVFRVNAAEEYPLPPEKGAGRVWQRFTERSRRVVFFAQEEAARLADNFVGTEHLLLGLIREDDSLAAKLLNRMGIDRRVVKTLLDRQMDRGDGRSSREMQLTSRAKRAIDLAFEEARSFNHNHIGSEHLLLGLIREGEGLAGRVLHGLGVDLGRTREEIRAWDEGMKPPEATGPAEVMLLNTESGVRAVPLGEIREVRVRLGSGEWVSGGWAGFGAAGTPEPGKDGRDIGEIMVERGWVTADELLKARILADRHPGTDIGRILIEEGYAEERDVAEALARSLNLRYVNLETTHPTPEAAATLPIDWARRLRVVPLMRKGRDLLVAIAARPGPSVEDEVRRATGCRITFAIAARSEVERCLSTGLDQVGKTHAREMKELARERARSLDQPFLDLAENPPSPDAVALVPGFMAWRYRAVPVRREGSQLLVACIDPLDPLMTQQLEIASGCTVHSMLGESGQVRDLLIRWYGPGEGIPPYIGLGQNDPAEEKEWEAASELARSLGLPCIHLPTLKPTPEALTTVPAELARRLRFVPVLKRGGELWVAAEDPGRPDLLPEIERASGCAVRLAVGLPSQIRDAIREGYGGEEGDNGGAPVPSPKTTPPPAPPEYQPVQV